MEHEQRKPTIRVVSSGCENSGNSENSPCSVKAHVLAHAHSFQTVRTGNGEGGVVGDGGNTIPRSLCSHRSQCGDSRHPNLGGPCSPRIGQFGDTPTSLPVRSRPAVAPALVNTPA